MKRNFIYLLFMTFILLIFLNYHIVLSSTIEAVDIWLYKVFPYLFIMLIINDLLINLDFLRVFKNTSQYVFVMSLLSGSPTSAYIINNLYKENRISKNNANISLMFTYFCNPLFLISILYLIFNNYYVVFKLIGIHYISNIIIYFLYRKRLDKDKIQVNKIKFDLSGAIKKSINTVTMVLGTIVLFMVVSEIFCNLLNLNIIFKTIFKGVLEVTQGLNQLIDLNFGNKLKEIITIGFISFGGLSIHTQIKCILDESNLKYKYFLKGRIIQLLVSIVLTILTNA